MPLDRVVAKSIWDGKVPVVLTLAQTDYASFKQADPLFVRESSVHLPSMFTLFFFFFLSSKAHVAALQLLSSAH